MNIKYLPIRVKLSQLFTPMSISPAMQKKKNCTDCPHFKIMNVNGVLFPVVK